MLTPSLPRSLTDLLIVFGPCFTAPTFATFRAMVAGFLAQPGLRTVTGMLAGARLAGRPNPSWEEAGLICQYEHCIELMPPLGVTREEHVQWREHIRVAMERSRYDDHPQRKRQLEKLLAEPIPADLPDEVDSTGACPIFGHYCPGGEETVRTYEAAQEWVGELQGRNASGRG
jgi:hypothetical protein